MAVFICYRQGCIGEVVGAGLCGLHLREEALKRKEAGVMTDHCKDCGKECSRLFVGRCRKCFNVWNATKDSDPTPSANESKAAVGETEPPVPEPKTAAPEPKEPVLTEKPCQDDKKSPSGPTPSTPEEKISVEVDFTRYPKIHKRLLELAEQEFRTPENQLLFLLHDHLAGLEETARKQEGAADGR